MSMKIKVTNNTGTTLSVGNHTVSPGKTKWVPVSKLQVSALRSKYDSGNLSLVFTLPECPPECAPECPPACEPECAPECEPAPEPAPEPEPELIKVEEPAPEPIVTEEAVAEPEPAPEEKPKRRRGRRRKTETSGE